MSYIPVPQRSWINSVLNGFTATVPDGVTIAILNSGSLLLTGTINLPVNPTDGQPLTLEAPNGITALTVGANGKTISGPTISTATAFTPIRLKYSAINQTWYPN